jgi:general secretion pathway protein L
MQGGGPALQSLRDGLLDFLAWWRDELRGLMPERARRLLGGEQPHVVLAQVESGFQVLQATAGPGGPVMPRADALMGLAELARKGTPIGIRLPLGLCFTRTVELPGAARKDLRRILDFELERATPFKQRDVYTAHTVEGQADAAGKLRVRQLVAKRELVAPLVAEVRRAGMDVAFVDCWSGQPGSGLGIDFLAASAPDGSGAGRFVTAPRALAALAVLLLVSAVLLMLSRYESALGEIQARIAQTRIEAAAVRQVLERSDAAVADLGRLQKLKREHIPAIQVLEELTRLLPDTVWLSDFRLEGDTLDISGLAKSGAALPPLFERSTIFADAVLTAPLTLDPREDKERFSLRVRIRQAAASRVSQAEGRQ